MPTSGGNRLRLVLDTNVVVAGLLWNGPPRRLLTAAVEGGVALFSSQVLLAELTQTLAYPKFANRLSAFGTTFEALVAHYAALVDLVTPTEVHRVVFDDADDDHVIAAAVTARAELIVTGDRKHLLPIGAHQGVAIVTVREALERIEARGKT